MSTILTDELRAARKARQGWFIRAMFAASICRRLPSQSELDHLHMMTRRLIAAGEKVRRLEALAEPTFGTAPQKG